MCMYAHAHAHLLESKDEHEYEKKNDVSSHAHPDENTKSDENTKASGNVDIYCRTVRIRTGMLTQAGFPGEERRLFHTNFQV